MAVDKRLLKGKTAEQKQVIKYFMDTGCLAALFGMKDEVYEEMVQTRINGLNLKQTALGKIGLDEDQVNEIAPIFLHGYNYDSDSLTKFGKDGRSRSSKYDAAYLFFSDTHVYMFVHTFDMTSGAKKESTEEYFYKDVTNFSTSSETVEVKLVSGCNGNKVSFKPIEYNRFGLIVPGDKFYCSTSGVPDAEKSISGMKQKLREKKQE
jgi:hypothetical protein